MAPTRPYIESEEDGNDGRPVVSSAEAVSDETKDRYKYEWILFNISASGFNVVSDVFAYITVTLFGFAFASLYPLFMTWQAAQSKNASLLLVSQLGGSMPGNLLQAAASVRHWRPLLAFVILAILAIADFSHSLADVGLDFVPVKEQGPNEGVLVYTTKDQRHERRPGQTAGDPLLLRTIYDVKECVDSSRTPECGDKNAFVTSFMEAVALIGRGGSPFVTEGSASNRGFLRDSYLGSVYGFGAVFMVDNSPSTHMAHQVPLNCDTVDMAQIDQVTGSMSPLNDDYREFQALLPNCSFKNFASRECITMPLHQQCRL